MPDDPLLVRVRPRFIRILLMRLIGNTVCRFNGHAHDIITLDRGMPTRLMVVCRRCCGVFAGGGYAL